MEKQTGNYLSFKVFTNTCETIYVSFFEIPPCGKNRRMVMEIHSEDVFDNKQYTLPLPRFFHKAFCKKQIKRIFGSGVKMEEQALREEQKNGKSFSKDV